MENLSLKNILWIVAGSVGGYFIGQIVGAITGTILWAFIGVMVGGLVYYSVRTIIINALLSVFFGILLALFVGAIDKRLFGNRMSSLIWGLAGAALGIIVMFSYGINVISHPEIYETYNHLILLSRGVDVDNSLKMLPPSEYLLQVYYGSGTGQLTGAYLGICAGLFISFRETIGQKRKSGDKKEFDEYSNFLKKRLEK